MSCSWYLNVRIKSQQVQVIAPCGCHNAWLASFKNPHYLIIYVYLIINLYVSFQDLTCSLYRHLMQRSEETEPHFSVKMLGVDIDPLLVQRAQGSNAFPEHIDFNTLNVLDVAQRDSVVTEFLTKHEQRQFDFVFAFSVSMWIHLNNGDQGLQDFLKYVCRIGKNIVIEPQPWKCYKTAVRRMKKLGCEPFEHFSTIMWRNEVDSRVQEYLVTECGMKLVQKFGQTCDWERTVCLFTKQNSAVDLQ